MDFDSCYQQPTKPTVTVTETQGWRVSRGILDSSNRESLYRDVATVPGTEYRFRFPIMPVDYTFPAGHRVGIVLIANLNALQRNGTTGTTVTLNTKLSKVDLPIVGGYEAAVSAGAIEPVTATGTVGGSGARHARPHRRQRGVPGVHARRDAGVHGLDDRERHQHRR